MAVLIVLPLQYALVGILGMTHGEPWPAVVFPGFQSVWDGAGERKIPRASFSVTFADGSREHVDVATVLAPFPASHHLGILRQQFTPATRSGSSRTERASAPETRRWLKQRLASVYPEREARQVDVIWSEVSYSPARSELDESPRDTLRLDLE